MPPLEAKPLDEWDAYDIALLWNDVMRAREMEGERGFPCCLAVLPLTRMWQEFEDGKYAEDSDPLGD